LARIIRGLKRYWVELSIAGAVVIILLMGLLLLWDRKKTDDEDDLDEEEGEDSREDKAEAKARKKEAKAQKKEEKARKKEEKARDKARKKEQKENGKKEKKEKEEKKEKKEKEEKKTKKEDKQKDKKKGGKKGKNKIVAQDEISEGDYSLITRRIIKTKGKYKSILFAAAGVNCLPITIPVNIAIELAKERKTVLLIDLDLIRNAIAQAFDVSLGDDPQQLRPKAHQTMFKGLVIWPAQNFIQSGQMNIKPLVEAAVKKFDFTLINAPYLDGSPDRMQIAATAKAAFIFTQNAEQVQRLAKLLEDADCKIIGNLQIALDE
jgi:flagellar biosynthesis GTPase FlhF